MKRYNLLMHKALGGGNFAQAKLAQYHHVVSGSAFIPCIIQKKAVTAD